MHAAVTPEARIVWDMDGTILDTTQVVPDAFIGAVADLGGPALDRASVVAAYSLGVPRVILDHLLGRPLRAGEAECYYQRLGDVTVSPYEGISECLDALRSLGHPITVFTGASTRAARSLLSAAGIEVDILIGGDQIARAKPAPDGLVEAARRLHTPPNKLFYLGDAAVDLQAATAAGAHSVAIAWGHLYRPDTLADHVLHHPTDALHLLQPSGP